MKKILIAFDGSDNAIKSAKKGISIAQAYNADIIVLYVIKKESSSMYVAENSVYGDSPRQLSLMLSNTSPEKAAVEILEKAEELFEDRGLKIKYLIAEGHVANNICSIAEEEQVDLIVMGRRGISSFKKFFLGSTSASVVQAAKTSVLLDH